MSRDRTTGIFIAACTAERSRRLLEPRLPKLFHVGPNATAATAHLYICKSVDKTIPKS